jgi:predicted RNase H-like HicB family nuclease
VSTELGEERMPQQRFTVEVEQEEDGRWIANVVDLPGCMAYGGSREDAVSRTIALALHVLADRIEHGEVTATAVAGVFDVAA